GRRKTREALFPGHIPRAGRRQDAREPRGYLLAATRRATRRIPRALPRSSCPLTDQGWCPGPGALLLTQVLQVTGLSGRLSEGLERWRAARAAHDPGKIIADLAVALALGGDWAGTAWPMWPCCGSSLRCSGRWRLIR